MQTFTFNELDKRGQDYAILRYAPKVTSMHEKLELYDWRFNEHGERIA